VSPDGNNWRMDCLRKYDLVVTWAHVSFACCSPTLLGIACDSGIHQSLAFGLQQHLVHLPFWSDARDRYGVHGFFSCTFRFPVHLTQSCDLQAITWILLMLVRKYSGTCLP
jgi:hypothetical protein